MAFEPRLTGEVMKPTGRISDYLLEMSGVFFCVLLFVLVEWYNDGSIVARPFHNVPVDMKNM